MSVGFYNYGLLFNSKVIVWIINNDENDNMKRESNQIKLNDHALLSHQQTK